MGFVYNLHLFPTVKERLGFDKVITISWVVHFLGHSVDGTRRAAVDGYASDFDLLT